jgi:hypothetical protein
VGLVWVQEIVEPTLVSCYKYFIIINKRYFIMRN